MTIYLCLGGVCESSIRCSWPPPAAANDNNRWVEEKNTGTEDTGRCEV